MWKLKSKLKRKFRSSKIDCNSNRVDYDVRSFESESPARPASEQSDTSVVVPEGGGYHRHGRGCCSAPVVGRRGAGGGGSASSENSSLFSYNCCYNYNFHINYNVHHRLQHHLGHHHRHHHHHGNDREGTDDTDGTLFGSTSCMTGLGSESSADVSRKPRPVSSEQQPQRTRAGSRASSTKVSSEPDVANKRLLTTENKTATRCLSTSDLSSYKSRSEQRSRNGEGAKKGKPSGTRGRRPHSASQRGRADSIEHTGNDSISSDYHAICRRLHAVSLQQESVNPSEGHPEELITNRTDLTDHDRRILHCMVLKRIKELEQLEEAVLAQQCWEQEKVFRKSLLDQQERNYRKAIRQKRTIEMIEVRNRKQRLARLEQQQIEKIQNEISEKDLRSASLLKNIEIKKGIRECERRSRELKRLEDATVNQEEKVLDRDIWRQSLVETLEERANRAEGLRRKVMDVYRRRLKIDNQLERKMHAHNLKQTLEQERYKLSLLKERILVRESRFQKFKDSKKRIFDQLKNRAKTTAALRDMVRHTIGPGSSATTVVTVSASNTRPGSVVQQQQQRCGSSARSAAGSIGPVPHRLLDVVRIK
ncbi:myotubularin-related protein DDB_G0290005 [Anopheles maculipalpis]|uniref:myotubularin-related protein DDB_G0290005 n=1 Tax=Anopheles maculipalpis TaxID=1496333 RepID=UPI002159A693|nr:myotubularin-related protein DDB_G0290005 [Anopheles maculipalpis]